MHWTPLSLHGLMQKTEVQIKVKASFKVWNDSMFIHNEIKLANMWTDSPPHEALDQQYSKKENVASGPVWFQQSWHSCKCYFWCQTARLVNRPMAESQQESELAVVRQCFMDKADLAV